MKACKCWAQIGKVLRSENASPQVCGYFYKAVVQVVLLFGSENWNLTPALLTWVEGFHIQCGYWMAQTHTRKRIPTNSWVHPAPSDVLTEYGLQIIEECARRWRQLIAVRVVDHLLFAACREGERMRGSPCRQW